MRIAVCMAARSASMYLRWRLCSDFSFIRLYHGLEGLTIYGNGTDGSRRTDQPGPAFSMTLRFPAISQGEPGPLQGPGLFPIGGIVTGPLTRVNAKILPLQ